MPTIFSHAVFATALGAASSDRALPWRFGVVAAICSIVPDFDVIAFAYRVPYASVWGHRGFTHSLLFALIVGVVAAAITRRAIPTRGFGWLATVYAAATVSHPLLDMLTNGGLGVALYAPLSNERYFVPWRPIRVSPLGAAFFSRRGALVLASEMVWIWAPSAALLAVGYVRRRTAPATATDTGSA